MISVSPGWRMQRQYAVSADHGEASEPPMIGQVLQSRYRVDGKLGRGGMGIVYSAYDLRLKRPVAVKMLNRGDLSENAKVRLLAEAQAAARLNHPNIVAIYDAGEEGENAFIVMELVSGQTLRKYTPKDLPELLLIFIQVCDALEHAHLAGIIHRDLKPENILVQLPLVSTPLGDSLSASARMRSLSIKLMDFGLARWQDSPNLTTQGALVGTFLYMAPELLMGSPATIESDLYALGVMFYELATGQALFQGADSIALISQHLYATPVPPSRHNPAIPPHIETMILRLLSKQPQDRPGSAGEVREALLSLAEAPATEELPGHAPLDRMVRGRFVARQAEMSEAMQVWRAAQHGESGVLLISGEPGVGKTRLVRELLAQMRLARATTLVGECYAEGGAPYAPIAHALIGLEPFPSDLPSLVLADLLTIAPALRLRFPAAPPNPPLDPAAEQERLFESVFSLLARLAARAPTMLVLEDAHWADRGTLGLMRSLARRVRRQGLPVLLVLTYREMELSEARALSDLMAELDRERLAQRIKLTRFDYYATCSLLEAIFADPVSEAFSQAVFRETEGNPFFTEELCKALIEAGQVYRHEGRWERAPLAELRLPQSVRAAIETRLERLPGSVQDVLRMAAVLGRRFEFNTLAAATELDEDGLIDALELAEKAQLLHEQGRAGGGVFQFSHMLIPATLRQGLSGLRLRKLHRRALAALEQHQPDDYEGLAWHCAEAGEAGRAIGYYQQAAQRAEAQYAYEDALRLYTEALALEETEPDLRFDLLAERAKLYDVLLQPAAGGEDVQAMLALTEHAGSTPRRCDALLAHARLLGFRDLPGAVQLARQSADLALALGDALRQGRALYQLAVHDFYRYQPLEAVQASLEQAAGHFRQAGATLELADTLSELSRIRRFRFDLPGALHSAEEAIAICRQAGDKNREACAMRRKAWVYKDLGQSADALPLAELSLVMHHSMGHRREERYSLTTLMWIGLGLAGRADSEHLGLRLFAEALADGDWPSLDSASYFLIDHIWLPGGDYGAAWRLLQETPALRDHQPIRWHNQYGTLCLLLGDYAAAMAAQQQRLQLSLALYGDQPFIFVESMEKVALAQAGLGDLPAARATLQQAIDRLDQAADDLDTQVNLSRVTRLHLDCQDDDPAVWAAALAWADHCQVLAERDLKTKPLQYAQHLHMICYYRARLHLRLGQCRQALTCSQQALQYQAQDLFHPQPDRTWRLHADCLLANDQPEAADELRQRAQERIQQVAESLDATQRQAWLALHA